MSIGAERVAAPPQEEAEWNGGSEASFAPVGAGQFTADDEEDAPRSAGSRILAALLFLLSLGWLGISGYALSKAWPGGSLIAWTGWAATISAPLILLALVWLIFGRSTRRETERFTRAVAAMRRESQALESVLAIVAGRLQDNRAALGEEAARLMALGDEASDRLGRVTTILPPRPPISIERRRRSTPPPPMRGSISARC